MQAHRRGPWSANEDSMLVGLVKSHGAHNWVRISALIGSRTPKQCRERFHQNLKPTLNHDPITAEEGALIERLVGEMGKRWAEIARRLCGRSDNAVKNWWNGGMNRRRRMVGRQAQRAARRDNGHPMHPAVHVAHGGCPRYSGRPPATPPPNQGLRIFVHGSADEPMVSPTYSQYTEFSRGQTPSLISDTASDASPRVPASPYENTLPPLLLGHHQFGQERRGSMPALFSTPDIYDASRYSHPHSSFTEKEEIRHPHVADVAPRTLQRAASYPEDHYQSQQRYQPEQQQHHHHQKHQQEQDLAGVTVKMSLGFLLG